jgi:transcriptional regulator with XRE-family HTH domain
VSEAARAREAAGLSRWQVARRYGVTEATVSAWENGRGCSFGRADELARLYRCSIWLFQGRPGGASEPAGRERQPGRRAGARR